MDVEHKDGADSPLPNGSSHQAKRGRGRPRGSLNKKFTTEKAPTHNARPTKKVDFFSPEVVIKAKVKKRGRPKKIKMPGRPRKIPLTPEEESERLQRLSSQRKRKLSKPLGRPRIHPLPDGPKVKRGRGRPRKYGGSQSAGAKQAGGDSLDVANGPPRKRGRPSGVLKRKRGRPAGSTKLARASDGNQKRRGRPPGSGNKVKKIQRSDGTPKRRGRPPGSSSTPKVKVVRLNPDGTPRKRGRPPGTGKKPKVIEKRVGDGSPKKRGRPPGTGKVKAQSAGDGQNAEGAPRRKRGRPSKVTLAVVLEKLPSSQDEDDDTDAPSPKQSRTSDDSSQNPNDEDDDTRASDNDADPEDEDDDEDTAIDCSKVNNTSENEMVGKFKKKK